MVSPLSISPGDKFHMLTLVQELPRVDKMRQWRVRCDCGTILDVLQKSFMSGGNRKSCGCAAEKPQILHGLSKIPEYRHWVNMISRCENLNTPWFEHYGGRGIRVCDRWRSDFRTFLADMGPRPSVRHSLDRVDVNGHYEPKNCRWATPKAQSRNQRSNHVVEVNGWKMTLAEAAEKASVSYNTVLFRLKRGWSIDDALKYPAKKGFRPHG